MNNIQEEFDKWYDQGDYTFNDGDEIYEDEWEEAQRGAYIAGNELTNLLPTKKVCPACGGRGEVGGITASAPGGETFKCDNCINGMIQIYYTPAQYEKIMGKPYPDDALVWCYTPVYIDPDEEENGPYETVNYYYWKPIVRKENSFQSMGAIVQTAQPAPPADYRPEE